MCWMFVLFDFPDFFLEVFFSRVTIQDNISRSFDARLTISIEESHNWIFNASNTSHAYNFFFLWHGTYIYKDLCFSIDSTSLNTAVK